MLSAMAGGTWTPGLAVNREMTTAGRWGTATLLTVGLGSTPQPAVSHSLTTGAPASRHPLLPFSSPPSPFPTPLAPFSSLCHLGWPCVPPLPSLRLSVCPPIGQGSLPRAGGDVFSLVRHPCQKHLVYKLASASRLPLHSSGHWTDKAEAPGPLPPAPGLGRQAHVHPWPPTHNQEGGWPPAARASLKDPT